MTRIAIWDCGCGVVCHVRDKCLIVEDSGGCPVEEILGKVRIFRDDAKTARAVLRKWLKGYEGGLLAAQENRLYVDVNGTRVRA